MCGIVAVSSTLSGSARCVEGLSRLQYRGYDSFGFAFTLGTGLSRFRSLEALEEMAERLPDARAIIGHTRWATHGAVSLENCHPHLDGEERFAVVHNGIVENHEAHRSRFLGLGRKFASDTDTEVIVALLEQALAAGQSRRQAVRATCAQLTGLNTFVVLFADEELFAVRQGSPLVLGKSSEAIYLASDVLSFAPWTNQCFAVPENALVRIAGQVVEITAGDGRTIVPTWVAIEFEPELTGQDGYRHYMIKEIMEQWHTIPRQAMGQGATLAALVAAIRKAKTVIVTGSGGAYYCARQIAWLLRSIAAVRALDVPAYEIDGFRSCLQAGDVMLAISQSGETADTIDAVRFGQKHGLLIASVVNMPLSTLSQVADFNVCNRSGPEICVLSTKSASAQITFGFLLAHELRDRTEIARGQIDRLSSVLTAYLTPSLLLAIEQLAQTIAGSRSIFLLGQAGYHASAQVGALNIKEASYIHAEAFSAGELKHGVIALIEAGTPVIVFTDGGAPMLNAAAEVKARGAYVIAIGRRNSSLFDVFVPLPEVDGPVANISSIIPCQLLAYYLGVARGINPDRPRNLAKSVTVR